MADRGVMAGSINRNVAFGPRFHVRFSAPEMLGMEAWA